MNQRVKLLVTSGLSLLLLAFFSIELTTDASCLDGGLASLLGVQRTTAQTNRLRKNSLSLWERDEVSARTVRRSGFISGYAKPLTLTLSQSDRELVSPLEGQQTKAQSRRSSTLVV